MKNPLEIPVFGAVSTIDPVDDNTAAVVPVEVDAHDGEDDGFGFENKVPQSHLGRGRTVCDVAKTETILQPITPA